MELTYFSPTPIDMSFLGSPKKVPEKDAKIIVFTGGADVTPSLYGANKHPKTYTNFKRDIEESQLFDRNLHKLKLGICRG